MKFSIIRVLFVISVINEVTYATGTFNINGLVNGLLGKIINSTENCLNCLTTPQELIRFYNYKPGSTEYNQVLINDTDVSNKIDLSKPVCFIVHGWIDSFFGGIINPTKLWMQDMAKEISQNQNINVVAVDWSYLSECDYIWASQENVPCVGKYIAKFIQYLIPFGLDVKQTTIIGHSLGAQIAGGAGASLNGNLLTIFGLDPAGPLFTYPLIASTDKRLDPTDAQFVQVLHTACGTFGEQINSGHADIYANFGILQPGCLLSETTPFGCSHGKALDYFISSITNPLKGYDLSTTFCQLVKSFMMKFYSFFNLSSPSLLCAGGVSDFIGFQTNRTHGLFYLITSANPPYYIN